MPYIDRYAYIFNLFIVWYFQQKCRNASWLPPNERKLIKAAHRETPPRKVKKIPRAKTLRFGLMPPEVEAEEEDDRSSSDQFHQTFQPFHHNLTINSPPTQTNDHGDDIGFEVFDNNERTFGDHRSIVAPQKNILSKFISEGPFESLPIMNSSMLHNIPSFEQQLDMDFNGATWESLILQLSLSELNRRTSLFIHLRYFFNIHTLFFFSCCTNKKSSR